jgi:Fic family protein
MRTLGTYRVTRVGDEEVRAFLPKPLPPKAPPLAIKGPLTELYVQATAALSRLAIAGAMIPNASWFLYGFVRKEALVSSQIEGAQATLEDVLAFEAARHARHPADVQEVCNYVDSLNFTRAELAKPKGLPLCTRLLCQAHARLMREARGADKQPGVIRTSQNWIGGTRPGNAQFVPPPPEFVPEALSALETWIHGPDPLPPLVRAGLAHVQFETIHPFLDGNGRVGRMLITLLVEHWGLLPSPLLYLSLAFKRHREEYYQRLMQVRTEGDWEGWTAFFLKCVREAADDGVHSAQRIFALVDKDRHAVAMHKAATVPAIQLCNLLPVHPMITGPMAVKLLRVSKPTAGKAVDALVKAGVLTESTGKRRDRLFVYRGYLKILTEDTAALPRSVRTFPEALENVIAKHGRALRRLRQ